ncbi:MAG: rhamnulokinase [Oscillospiraceae bacterium]|nr:rhamnulokinase [Oscillospiraceae bacterium]
MAYYLAVDLGASSGKHVLARIVDDKIEFEVVHRFKNEFIEVKNSDGTNSSRYWDLDYLFTEIVAGMKKCAEMGKIPSFVGVDTWGVDYVLLNSFGSISGNAVSYRDERTSDIPEYVFRMIPEEELYKITGIQRQPFNTIFQLYAQSLRSPEELQSAQTLLMLPCYFNYLLSGVMANEYTIASTSGLVNARSRDWDDDIIRRLGLSRSLFHEILPTGTILGELTPGIAAEVGYNAKVALVCTHDTASAVLAAPLTEKSIYLSSGTWSLMGVEIENAVLNEQSRLENFTNEGGFKGSYRFLKNIMGLWLLRAVRKDFGSRHDYNYLSRIARENEDFPSIIDVSDNRFFAPASMVDEIIKACTESGMQVPETAGEVSAVIYRSLAAYYGKTAEAIERLTGNSYDTVNMVGGGTRDKYLNKLTAKACKKRVLVGPTEATALGNIISQMLTTGELKTVKQAREMIKNSVALEEYRYEHSTF